MKKAYKKSFVLDTNLFKNLVGFDKETNTIQNLYYKDKLLKHIKNHGCKITIYSLIEILRDEKLDNPNIKNNILNFNFDVLSSEKNFNFTNIRESFFDVVERQRLLDFSLKHLVQYASEFYARLLIVPYLYCMYAVDITMKEKNIKANYYKINNFTHEIIVEITKQLKKAISEKTENFKKTKMLNVINNAYKWITAITMKWFNSELNHFGETFELNDLYNAINSYKNYIVEVDFGISAIDADNSNKAKSRHNFLKIINDSTYKQGQNIYSDSKEDWNKKSISVFIDFIQRTFKSQDKTRVADSYLFSNIYNAYIYHLYDDTGNENDEKIINLIDTNDIVDLLNLFTIQTMPTKNKLLYLTLDGSSISIINKVYTKAEKETFYDFIKIREIK